MGEDQRRSGTDFERSIAEILTRLGYEIVSENEPVKCQVPEHRKNTHGIDFVAKPSSRGLCRPVSSPDGLTLFCCRHANIGEGDISEAQQTSECLRLSSSYKDLKGAVLVTAAWVQRDLRDAIRRTQGLYLWDQARCHLYGNLARHYASFKNIRAETSPDRILPLSQLETIVTRALIEKAVGFFGLFNYYEIGIFYEGDSRFNFDSLRNTLQELRRCSAIPRFSLNRIMIHTARGFTTDFSLKINETLESFISRSVGFICSPSDLYDHSNPWFPTYVR
jgi:hypothetical protein